MKRRLKRLNKIQIISTLLLIVAYILTLFNIKSSDYLFMMILGFNMYGYLRYVSKWSNEGRTWYKKTDEKYDKNLTRKPSDTMFFMLISYYLLIVMVFVADIFINNFMKESILGMLSVAIIWNYLGLIIVDKTYTQVERLAEESGKGKQKK